MKKIAFLLAFLTASTALGVAQTTKQGRMKYALQMAGMPSAKADLILAGLANVLYYDTAAELSAATPTEGALAYAIDTNAFYIRAGSAWVALGNGSGILGTNGGTIGNETNNVWTLAENSENLTLTYASDLVTFASGTSATFVLTPATTITGDLTLNGGAGALTFGAGSSSIVVPDGSATALVLGSTGRLNFLNFDTTDNAEKLTVTGYAGALGVHVDVGEVLIDEGAQITVPVMAYGDIRFCGNGPNATTATYVGPVLPSDTGTDHTYGSAGCDAKDNTTEATADLVWHAARAFKPVGMHCVSDCGTDDTMTLQLRDDEASVAGMTCDITLTGSAASCSVYDRSPATVAVGSAIAVSVVNSTDDDCSSGDVECVVFFTYP